MWTLQSYCLLSARTAMWSMPVILTETENENGSANQNYAAKVMLQKWCCKNDVVKWRNSPNYAFVSRADGIISPNKPLIFILCLICACFGFFKIKRVILNLIQCKMSHTLQHSCHYNSEVPISHALTYPISTSLQTNVSPTYPFSASL